MQKDTENGKAKSGPEGLGGWLLVVGFMLILGLIVGLLALFGYISIFLDVISLHIAVLHVAIGIELAVHIIYMIAQIYLLYLFFKKNKKFPKYYVIFLWSLIAWGLINAFMLASIASIVPEAKNIANDLRESPSLIGALIWILYTHKSRRVKATFVEE